MNTQSGRDPNICPKCNSMKETKVSRKEGSAGRGFMVCPNSCQGSFRWLSSDDHPQYARNNPPPVSNNPYMQPSPINPTPNQVPWVQIPATTSNNPQGGYSSAVMPPLPDPYADIREELKYLRYMMEDMAKHFIKDQQDPQQQTQH